MITITEKDVKKSDLKHTVSNNFYFSSSNDKMTLNYDFYEIRDDIYLIGYMIKYILPTPSSEIEHIDIYILSNFRRRGLGSKALNKYIKTMSKAKVVLIKTTKPEKISFLKKNGFTQDTDYIYKSLYRYERNERDIK